MITDEVRHAERSIMISAITKNIVDKAKSHFLWLDISGATFGFVFAGDISDAVRSILNIAPAAPINPVDNVRYRFILASHIVKAVKKVLCNYLAWQFDSDEAEGDFVNELEESLRATLLEYNKLMLVEWRYS